MADLMDFRVLSFDCYGTLIDWETGILAEIRPWLEGSGLTIEDGRVLEAFGVAESEEEAENPDTPYPLILQGVHDRLAARWGVAPDRAAAVRFGASVERWPAYPDSNSALRRLGKRYRLVILSNVDRASFAHSSARLYVEFDAVYTAEDIGSYKPDPRNFAYLIEQEERQGYSLRDILHVGQSLFHDHVPASEAGLATCWIQRPSPAGVHGATRPPDHRPEVDYHFTSLAALVDAVDA